MQIKLVCLSFLIMLFACQKKESRFVKDVPALKQEIVIKNVSEDFFDTKISNQTLKEEYPNFFKGSPNDILSAHRTDSTAIILNKAVQKEFNPQFLSDSLSEVFKYVKYYFPDFKIPTVYSFTGETLYDAPINYWRSSNDMVIGLDWFLGKNYPLYEQMGIPLYLRSHMEKSYFNIAVAKSIAEQYIPLDINVRKFIEKLIYSGKVLVAAEAFNSNRSPQEIMGYTPEQWQWCKENEADIYVYFTEQQYFFSEDRKLDDRFIQPAPFSKFYSNFDKESPGSIGTWVGWQICNHYLEKNPNISLKSFLEDTDYLKIFRESKYKPTK